MKKLIHVMSSVLLVVALAGCATSSLTSVSYVRPEARQVQAVETATVVAVRSVVINPQRNNTGLGVGATLGATLGAAVGNRVGGGYGRVAATVITALLGGVAGQRAEFTLATVPGLEITYAKGDQTYAVVQEDDGSRFTTGEVVAVVTGSGWPGVTRIAKR